MGQLSGIRRLIFEEETRFKGAVSEFLAQKLGEHLNFISLYQFTEKAWDLNGNASQITLPYLGIDGLKPIKFDAEIVDVYMNVRVAGSSGTFELDIKKATTPGGVFTSIFSQRPQIQAAAGDWVWVNLGSAVANTVAPVLVTANLDAGDVLRCDVIDSQSGDNHTGGGMVLLYRPR